MREVSLIFAVCLLSSCAVTFIDAGPTFADGTDGAERRSSAGVVYQLAGDQNAMYAVSLNAGVWQRLQGDRWRQLPNSSALATAIAIDPTNPRHIATSDRNNDASDSGSNSTWFDLSLSGVRESFDGGDSWQVTMLAVSVFSSLRTAGTCQSVSTLAIPAVTFTPQGTLVIGTPCGIGRKLQTEGAFNFIVSPPDISFVNALAVSRTSTSDSIVWALGQRRSTGAFVLLSAPSSSRTPDQDAANWTITDIPPTIGTTPIPFASGQPGPPGDAFSIAAFGNTAVLLLAPPTGNKTNLIYFQSATSQFSTQTLDGANNGTGWGGRRSLRSVSIRPPFLPGNGARVFVNAGQNVLEATDTDESGQLKWKSVATANCGDCDNPDPVHSDLWDVLPAADSDDFWLACDGGVFEHHDGFRSINAGLFTQHIHKITVVSGRGGKGGSLPNVDYATSDNDAWFRNGAAGSDLTAGWDSYGQLGDANWVAADRGNGALSLEVRDGLNATLTDFGVDAPDGTSHVGGDLFPIACSIGSNGDCGNAAVSEGSFKVLQTGPGGPFGNTGVDLDVSWLAALPLERSDDGKARPLSTSLAQQVQGATGTAVLLRNFAFAVSPSASQSEFNGWFLVASDVPVGATRLWESVKDGDYLWNTVYYVCLCDTASTGPARVFKRADSASGWQEIHVTVPVGSRTETLDVLRPTETSNRAEIGGPLFVDPLDPDRLVVLTTHGIALSNDGGTTWALDDALTRLLTASGMYPLASGFPSGNSVGVVLATRGLRFMYASDVAFGWANRQLAVASPFTGVFVRVSDDAPWLNAESALPQVHTPVSSIAFWGPELYVGFEGRSLVMTDNLFRSRQASYFKLAFSPITQTLSVRLLGSTGSPLKGSSLKETIVGSDGAVTIQTVTTTDLGDVPLLPPAVPGARVFLEFDGNDTWARANTAFHL